MKVWNYFLVLYCIFYGTGFLVFGQESAVFQKIDSLNALTYEQKITNPSLKSKLFEKALQQAKQYHYQKGIADLYTSLALISYYQGKFDKNTFYSLQAMQQHAKLQDFKKLCTDYAEYGYQLKRRNLKQAIFFMQKGKRLAEAKKYTFELGGIYDNYGVLKEFNSELDSALYYYQKALTVKKKHKDTHGIPYSLNNIAGIYMMQKNFTLAQKYLEEAYRNRVSQKDSIGLTESLSLYGSYYEAKEDYEKAIAYWEQAKVMARENGYKNQELSCYLALAALYEKNNHSNKALSCLKKQIQLNDSLNNLQLQQDQMALDTEFQTQEKEKVLLITKAEVAKKNLFLIGVFGLLLCSLLLGYLVFFRQKSKTLHLEQQMKLQTALAQVEMHNKLQEQRVVISRDLHDNIGSQLTFIISSIENIKFFIGDQNDKVFERLSKISNYTKETITELRDTIWAMNKDTISMEDLLGRVSNHVNQAKLASVNKTIEFSNTIEENYKRDFSSQEGIYIFRIIQEALNNAIKYSDAAHIHISFSLQQEEMQISIHDNGKGFHMQQTNHGHGLSNMYKRAAEIGAVVEIHSNLGKGTNILLKVSK